VAKLEGGRRRCGVRSGLPRRTPHCFTLLEAGDQCLVSALYGAGTVNQFFKATCLRKMNVELIRVDPGRPLRLAEGGLRANKEGVLRRRRVGKPVPGTVVDIEDVAGPSRDGRSCR